MNIAEINVLLNQAERDFANNDPRKGMSNVLLILKDDFTNDAAWRLLYRVMKSDQPFEVFQMAIAQKNFPDKVHLLLEKELFNVSSSIHPEEFQSTQTLIENTLPSSTQGPAPINNGYCPECGTSRMDNSRFCPNCGYAFWSVVSEKTSESRSNGEFSQQRGLANGQLYSQQNPSPNFQARRMDVVNNQGDNVPRYHMQVWMIIVSFVLLFSYFILPRFVYSLGYFYEYIFLISILWFCFWAIKGIIGGIILINKNFRGSTWIWALIVPIVIPLAYLAIMGIGGEFVYAAARNRPYSHKKCPYCKGWIPMSAIRCQHCSQSLVDVPYNRIP